MSLDLRRPGPAAAPISYHARLHRGLPLRGVITGDAVVTIGSFDGVHRGHQKLIRRVIRDATAGRGAPVVLTFDPHPRCIVDVSGCPPMLTTIEERFRLLQRDGAVHVVVLEFTRELSAWSAERFCDALAGSLDLRRLVVGPGFALGRGRRGDAAFLSAYGAGRGFDVVTASPAISNGAPISSGRVRRALGDGRIGEANSLLGHRYLLSGMVVRGDRRGRTLDFPTANVAVQPGRCLPAPGVYATWIQVADAWHRAATSIGYRPTFGGGALTIEAYILDFDADIYQQAVELQFVARLRGERTFPGADQLVRRMHLDVEIARRHLATAGPPEL